MSMQLKKTHVIRSSDGTITKVKVYDTKEKMKYAVKASIDCCNSIIEVTDGMDSETFLRNQTVMKSVAMDLQIIGNFMKEMPIELLSLSDILPDAYGFRCVIAHDYGNVRFDSNLLWEVVENDITQMKKDLESIGELLINEEIELV